MLAGLAKGRMRKKQADLERALVGQLTEHHRFMLNELLDQLDVLDQQIAKIEGRIEEQLAQMPPFRAAVILLDTLPGVDRQLAIAIVAEIGVHMSRFPSDRHITAWAGVAPGNNETGGKQRSGKTRKGNKYLLRALTLAAWVLCAASATTCAPSTIAWRTSWQAACRHGRGSQHSASSLSHAAPR